MTRASARARRAPAPKDPPAAATRATNRGAAGEKKSQKRKRPCDDDAARAAPHAKAAAAEVTLPSQLSLPRIKIGRETSDEAARLSNKSSDTTTRVAADADADDASTPTVRDASGERYGATGKRPLAAPPSAAPPSRATKPLPRVRTKRVEKSASLANLMPSPSTNTATALAAEDLVFAREGGASDFADDIARGVVTPKYADVPFEELFEWNPSNNSPTLAAAEAAAAFRTEATREERERSATERGLEPEEMTAIMAARAAAARRADAEKNRLPGADARAGHSSRCTLAERLSRHKEECIMASSFDPPANLVRAEAAAKDDANAIADAIVDADANANANATRGEDARGEKTKKMAAADVARTLVAAALENHVAVGAREPRDAAFKKRRQSLVLLMTSSESQKITLAELVRQNSVSSAFASEAAAAAEGKAVEC